MNKTKIIKECKSQCQCSFDHDNQEFWKCTYCEAVDYIQLLAYTMEEIGCPYCNGVLKELLE